MLYDAAQLPVEAAYRHLLTPLSGKYYYNTINVYRGGARLIPIWYHKDRVEGSLAQVNFNLIYSASEGLHADIYSVRLIVEKRK